MGNSSSRGEGTHSMQETGQSSRSSGGPVDMIRRWANPEHYEKLEQRLGERRLNVREDKPVYPQHYTLQQRSEANKKAAAANWEFLEKQGYKKDDATNLY